MELEGVGGIRSQSFSASQMAPFSLYGALLPHKALHIRDCCLIYVDLISLATLIMEHQSLQQCLDVSLLISYVCTVLYSILLYLSLCIIHLMCIYCIVFYSTVSQSIYSSSHMYILYSILFYCILVYVLFISYVYTVLYSILLYLSLCIIHLICIYCIVFYSTVSQSMPLQHCSSKYLYTLNSITLREFCVLL